MSDNEDSENKNGQDEDDTIQEDFDDALESDADDLDDYKTGSVNIKIPPIDNIIDSMINIISEEKKDLDKSKKPGPYVWGFSLTLSPDQKPIIREFGNIKSGPKGVSIQEEREPLIEMIEDDLELVILFELPGVSEDEISLECNEKSCKLEVHGNLRFQKIIEFPTPINPKSKIMRYQNGILEIKFKK